MADPIKTDIWNCFKKVREITVSHIPDKSAMRFDYDCRLFDINAVDIKTEAR